MRNDIIDVPYEVVKDREVHLTIIFGQGQRGFSVVELQGNEIGEGKIDNCRIGVGQDLDGKVLSVWSMVGDVRENTNRTSIRYRLQGGKKDKEFNDRKSVERNTEAMSYRAEFNLYLSDTDT